MPQRPFHSAPLHNRFAPPYGRHSQQFLGSSHDIGWGNFQHRRQLRQIVSKRGNQHSAITKGQVIENTIEATPDENGIWRTSDGNALHVSASDMERHAYCPLSWQLSRRGVAGVGHAVEEGVRKHNQINQLMKKYDKDLQVFRRELTVWSWWFGIIIAFVIDAIAFFAIDQVLTPQKFARYLVILGFVWLLLGIMLTVLPWREKIGLKNPATSRFDMEKMDLFEPLFESEEFKGGWYEGGKIEVGLLFSSIITVVHGTALWRAVDREQAGYILLIVALLWTLFASWRLQRVLLAETEMEISRQDVGLDEDAKIAYSDDSSATELLQDEETGLRGRPDQIVIIDGEFVPLEQKTGKIPREPHLSHSMQVLAYLHLVEKNTGRVPPYGVLRYGEDAIFQIDWDSVAKEKLHEHLVEIQRLMVEGGAKRNHERKGKCQNCSRRHACPDSLA